MHHKTILRLCKEWRLDVEKGDTVWKAACPYSDGISLYFWTVKSNGYIQPVTNCSFKDWLERVTWKESVWIPRVRLWTGYSYATHATFAIISVPQDNGAVYQTHLTEESLALALQVRWNEMPFPVFLDYLKEKGIIPQDSGV